jgi:hypothetical protein
VRIRSTSVRRACVGLTVLASLGGGAILRASAQDGKPDSPVAPRTDVSARDSDPRSVPVIRRLQPWQRARIALFRGQPQALPLEFRRVIGAPIYGVNWALAQQLPVAVADVWAVPGDNHICLFDRNRDQTVGGACASRRQALKQGVTATHLTNTSTGAHIDQRTIVGIVPDRTQSVEIHVSGTLMKAQVIRNVFAVRDGGTRPPDRITLR